MILQRERVTLKRRPVSPNRVCTGFSRNTNSAAHRSISDVETLLDLQRSRGNAFVHSLVLRELAMRRLEKEEEK
jgi:hypothetical protein